MPNEIPPLGGYQAVANILGVTRGAIYDRWKRMQTPRSRSDFPRPVTITSRGPLWNLNEIRDYKRRKDGNRETDAGLGPSACQTDE